MDFILISLIIGAVVLFGLIYFLNKSSKKGEKEEAKEATDDVAAAVNRPRNNRAANRERLRNRLRARNNPNAANDNNNNSDIEDELDDVRNFAANIGALAVQPVVDGEDGSGGGGDDDDDEQQSSDLKKTKVGTKKLAKLEAKAERRAMNEQIQREREERKEREKVEEEKRKKEEEEEKRIERENEEREKRLREEQERREHEEYLKLKQQFVVEEEGQEETLNEKEEENLLQEFVAFIKKSKVVILEDLAAEFKLKTQDVITRITQVEEMGLLTGLMDDRGKYIYVSEDELKKVATFLRQRGRVSIHELAQASCELLNLNPQVTVE